MHVPLQIKTREVVVAINSWHFKRSAIGECATTDEPVRSRGGQGSCVSAPNPDARNIFEYLGSHFDLWDCEIYISAPFDAPVTSTMMAFRSGPDC